MRSRSGGRQQRAQVEDPVRLILNETQAKFCQSEAAEVALFSPRGEGKTQAGIAAMIVHAGEQPEKALPVVWCIVRDTWANIKRTTLRDFYMSPWARYLKFPDGGREVIFQCACRETPCRKGHAKLWHAHLFGVDSPGDLERLKGTWGGIWFEEPAPVAVEDISGGIGEDAWAIAHTGLRQPGVRPRAQITANPPQEDHWIWERFMGEGRVATVEGFQIPIGENKHLPTGYRERMALALRNRPDLARRLVHGLPGFVAQGEAVTPEWSEKKHVSAFQLEVLRAVELKIGWDFGLRPSMVFAQVSPLGQLRIYDVLVGDNIGVEQIIESQAWPLLQGKYRGLGIAHYGGPEGFLREQSNSEQTAVTTLTRLIPGPYTPGPVEWAKRRDVLRWIHNHSLGGVGEAVVMDPVGALPLIRACRGGWHYKKLPNGEVIRELPVKDKHSHPGDAYAAMVAGLGFGAGVQVVRSLKSIKSPSYSWSEPTIVLGR